jgi:putative aldouronate transport system permease protein
VVRLIDRRSPVRLALGERCYLLFAYLFLGLFSLATLYPFVYVLSASLSSGAALSGNRVWLLPVEPNLAAYREIMAKADLWRAYGNSLLYTACGTALALGISIGMAYALSKRRLRGRGILTFVLALTMWFSAGLIPAYLNIRSLGLINTRAVMIVLGSVSAFNIIILRTFFQSIPASLEESASMDGATDFQVLRSIMLPCSIPAIATVGLYYGVGYWNSFFGALIYLQDLDKIPIQLYLKNLIIDMRLLEQMDVSAQARVEASFNDDTFMYATLIVSIIPIVAVYPLLLKYFVKGAMVGSIKG